MGFEQGDSVRLTQRVYDSASGKEFEAGTYGVVTRTKYDDVWLQVTDSGMFSSKRIEIKVSKWDIN